MRLYEEMYSLNELERTKGGLEMRQPQKSYLTFDHFDGTPRLSYCERYEYENGYRQDPILTMDGYRRLFRTVAVLVILAAILLLVDKVFASNLSTQDALDALWALNSTESDDWDYIYEDAEEGEWLVPAMPSETLPKTDEFPETTRYSGAEVGQVQGALALNGYGIRKSETEKQRFGPGTALAVKKFQVNHRLEPTGVVNAETLRAMDLNENLAGGKMRYEVDLSSIAAKSVSSYLIYVSTNPDKLSGPVLSVFARTWDSKYQRTYWRLLSQYDAAIGTASESGNITPLGAFLPTCFIDVPDEAIGGKVYYYQIGFADELAVLSVGYDPETKEFDNWVVDHNNSVRRDNKGRLTGGSVRVAYTAAQWLYVNCDYDTYIVIDDRNYG